MSSLLLKFEGVPHFRQRIMFSTLSGRPVRIDAIRLDEDSPGVKDFEANFLRLVDKVTNGSKVEINVTGTTVLFRPGTITGGKSIEHDCGSVKSIGWFIEGILPLLLFGKQPTVLNLTGVTNDDQDIMVDALRTVTAVLLKKFGVETGFDVKVVRRGCAPVGDGFVILRVPIVKTLKAAVMTDVGRFLRIRGTAFATKVSPQMANRMVDASRGDLRRVLDDIFISTDHARGTDSNSGPGFGLSLIAETTSGTLVCAERCSAAGGAILPEDLAVAASHALCEEMASGGVVDSQHQSLALTLMALCPEDVSRIRLGRLTPYTIQTLRHLRDFFGVTFKIVTEAGSRTVLLSCLGIGYKNLQRPAQ